MLLSEAQGSETTIFAGGCFWCMEPVFDSVDGVLSVLPGYAGGSVENPSYQEVCEGETGHLESVRIVFDPHRVTFRELLLLFWHNIDPTLKNRQFCDYGPQYQTAIFYVSEAQREIAVQTKRELDDSGRLPSPIATEIRPASTFYPAEEYHRQYYRKNPMRYQQYHQSCGRKQRLAELWQGEGGRRRGRPS